MSGGGWLGAAGADWAVAGGLMAIRVASPNRQPRISDMVILLAPRRQGRLDGAKLDIGRVATEAADWSRGRYCTATLARAALNPPVMRVGSSRPQKCMKKRRGFSRSMWEC